MKIRDLISALQLAEQAEGNIDVICGSFCGTNNGHVTFDLKVPKDFVVANHMCSLGLSLQIEISESSKEKIQAGVNEMAKLGYTYRSQYVERGQSPKSGLSPCDWHTPW